MNKLQEVRYEAAYTQLAQKLDKHMKQFDSDKNTQIRWIWELIQNAKDAPNRFKQTKIKQSLDDYYFTSMHNGDAFQIPQLHSVVAQYSTKKEKNSDVTKTTGKYGTGFITTYILSKIIEVSAILKVQILEDSDDENQNTKMEAKNYKGFKNFPKGKSSKHQYQIEFLSNQVKKLSTNDDDNIDDFQKRTNFQMKESKIGKEKKGQSTFYYKRFSIPLDRSYVDRDEQLPKKIEKTEKRLTKIVMEAEYESTHNPDFTVRDYEEKQRTVDSFDTEFKYKLTDKRKFEMIENALVILKQLLPYAFLFNDNLVYYEFIDDRKFKERDFSFSLTKGEVASVGTNINLFTYQIQVDYDHKSKKFLTTKIGYLVAYFENERAIAAVPVHIEESGIQILKVDERLPKYFKDFPLIGCSDLKWNAFINSRQFYPNETRSQLLLSCTINETNLDKVQTNWINLYKCLNGVKEVYLFLSHHCKSGLENLLIFSDENKMGNENGEFKAFLTTLIKEICSSKIIPNRILEGQLSQNSVQPKNLAFIELASIQKEIYNKNKNSHLNLSFKANQSFGFLYGNENTISPDHYAAFYEILNYSSPYRKYLQSLKCIRFITVNMCLQKMSKMNLQQFCVHLKGNYVDKLHEVYSFLKSYNQSAYLTLSSKNNQPFFDFNIFFNEKNEFKRLRADKLMFNNLPKVYEQLAKILDIDIKTNLLHEQFRKYVKENDPTFSFDIAKMENKIVMHFEHNKIKAGMLNQLSGFQHLLSLFCLLITFKCLDNQTINLVKRFVDFDKAAAFIFKSNTNGLHKFRNDVEKKLVKLFIDGFTYYFQRLTEEKVELKGLLSSKINIKYFDQAVDYMKDLMRDKTLGTSLSTVPVKLSWSGVFMKEEELQKLNDKVEYPDFVDIQIYNVGYNYRKATYYFDKLLQQRLVHLLYPRQALTRIKVVTYEILYKQIKNSWQHLPDYQQKHQILTYVSQINNNYLFGTCVDNTIREKYTAWKNFIDTRLERLFSLKLQKKQFEQESTKEFLYRLMDDKQELNNAKLIYQNNSNNLYFTTLCQQLNLIQAVPKVQKPKENAKI